MLPIPRPGDSPQDTLKKILWATLAGNFGISSAAEYNTAVQNVVNQGGDPSDINLIIQNAPSAVATRVGGFTGVQASSPSTDATYAAGDVIVAPTLIQGAFRPDINTGMLQSLTVLDSRGVAAPLIVVFWRSTPTGHAARNAPFVMTGALSALYLGHVAISADDYVAAGSAVAATKTALALPVNSVGTDKDLFYSVYSNDAVDYVTSATLWLTFGVFKD